MLAHYEIKVTRTDKIKDPIKKTSNEQHQEGGFFEKLEKTFQEISDELNDEPEKKQSKPFETSLPPLNEDWNEK